MNTEKALLILGAAIAPSLILFGVILIYFRTQSQHTFGVRKSNQRVNWTKRGYNEAITLQPNRVSSRSADKHLRTEQIPQQLQTRLLTLLNSDRNTADC